MELPHHRCNAIVVPGVLLNTMYSTAGSNALHWSMYACDPAAATAVGLE